MGCNWSIEVKGCTLGHKYLWLRYGGIEDEAIEYLREVYKYMNDWCDGKIDGRNRLWNPVADLYALMLIRRKELVEGWQNHREFCHAIVDLEAKTITLKGEWWHNDYTEELVSGTKVFPLEVISKRKEE